MKCADFRRILRKELPPLYECEEREEKLAIVTPVEYPDGDYVELFVIPEDDGYVLTDLAETTATLASYKFNLKGSQKRFKLFQQILKAHGVHYFQGELRIPFQDESELPQALVRLTQAVVQVSDLLFTMRYGAGTSFREEVEEYLIEHEVRFEPDYSVVGRSGQTYTIDFYVERRKPFLIQTLSSGSSGYAEVVVSKTVRMWYDLRRLDGRYRYSSVLDDSTDIWKPSHLEILSDLSEIIVWSEREKLLQLIAATNS